MTRCGTDSRRQYRIFCGELQTSFSWNTTRAGSEEGQLFSQASWCMDTLLVVLIIHNSDWLKNQNFIFPTEIENRLV